MASLETTCEQIFTREGAWRRVLFGGLLCLTILGIPFAAGYLFCYSLRLRQNPRAPLPPWENLEKLWRPGWHMLAILGVWYLLPVIIVLVAGELVESATFGLLWWGGYLISAIGIALAPSLAITALVHYQGKQDWAALWDYKGVFELLHRFWPQMLLPTLVWAGLVGIFLPLLPFSFFLGFTILLAYYTPLLSNAAKTVD